LRWIAPIWACFAEFCSQKYSQIWPLRGLGADAPNAHLRQIRDPSKALPEHVFHASGWRWSAAPSRGTRQEVGVICLRRTSARRCPASQVSAQLRSSFKLAKYPRFQRLSLLAGPLSKKYRLDSGRLGVVRCGMAVAHCGRGRCGGRGFRRVRWGWWLPRFPRFRARSGRGADIRG
jgi:hypothetical protein